MEINRQQFLIRLIYFFYLAGLSCLMPYLPVFMRHKGLSESQIGLIRGAEAIALMLFTPLWGYVTDKTSRHKLVLLLTITAATLFSFCILFIPSTSHAVACFSSSSCIFTDTLFNVNADLAPLSLVSDNLSSTTSEIICNISSSGNISTNNHPGCISVVSHLCDINSFPSLRFSSHPKEGADICFSNSLLRESSSCKKTILYEDLVYESTCYYCCIGRNMHSTSLCCNNTLLISQRTSNFHRIIWTTVSSHVWGNWISFLLIAVLLLFSSLFRCSIFPILDVTSMELLEGSPIRYNKERLWGSVGWGLFALVSGVILDVFFSEDFASCFYLSLSLTAIAAIAVGCLRFPAPVVAQHCRGLNPVMWRLEITVFFLLALVMGFSFGIIGTFLLLYVEDLHGPFSLMGLTMTVSCLAEVPFLYISGTLTQYLGHHGILLIALVCYTVRFGGYSLISTPWLVLPFELLHGITYGASWAGCSFYANDIAPPGLANTLLKIFTALYMGLGKGVGALAGGFMYEYVGPQLMFRVAALVSILSSLLYYFAVLMIKRRGTNYKQFIDTLDDAEEPSGSVQMDTHRRPHERDEDPSRKTDQPPLTIQGRKRSMHLPLTDIYQPENPMSLSIDQDQECLLSSEATPPELRVTRLEFQPPPDWLKGRSYGGADTTESKRDMEVRMDAIGSELDPRGGRRRGTLTSLV